MKKFLALASLSCFLFNSSGAQLDRYIIYLKNKGATTHTLENPATYLSQRAIERRTRYGISIDSTDLPVPASYISQIQAIPDITILNTSRWLNAISIHAADANAVSAVNALPFVQAITAIAERGIESDGNKMPEEIFTAPPIPAARPEGTQGDFFNYGANSFNEIHLHQGEFLHNIGLRGQEMQVAILDAGFLNYTTLDALDSMMANAQVLSTWDFVYQEASVVEDNSHGMMCLSIIAANIPGQFIGKAPKASFHLFKTEDTNSEYPIEEFNWVCGAERADSTGADIISSSLGYNTFDNAQFNHTYNDMNGDIAISTKGADKAAQKGILVFNAVGNYGAGAWHYLASPADGDSVVAVGAVNAAAVIWPSSSFGPSADGRIKPDVASVGFSALIQNPANTIGSGNGTSFACPNMAGLATCLWQGFPEFNNMRIVRALKEAGNITNSPDDRIGYGIPDMKSAFSGLLAEYASSSLTVNACTATLNWNTKDVGTMKFEIERKAPGEPGFTKIGELASLPGDQLSIHNYQFNNTLVNTGTGTLSYRIRQVIDTNSASFAAVYIDTATITLSQSCTTTAVNDPAMEENKILVLPNPANNQATIMIHTIHAIPEMPVSLYDMKGRLVWQVRKSKGPGKAFIDLPVKQLANGSYIIHVYDKLKLIGTAELLKL